jgi:propanol-preferring alcohol dehydrogenase
MPGMMKAAVVRSFGKPLAIEDVPIPTPGPGEVLVKVRACGVCHTDLHAVSGDWPVKRRFPSFRVTRSPGPWPRSGRVSTL